jgi:hypothetical protein
MSSVARAQKMTSVPGRRSLRSVETGYEKRRPQGRGLPTEISRSHSRAPGELLQLQRTAGNRAVTALLSQTGLARKIMVQRFKEINGIAVYNRGMPSWNQNGVDYHLNTRSGETNHVTDESTHAPYKVHYFFRGFGDDIQDQRPKKQEQGRNKKKLGKKEKKNQGVKVINTKRVFTDLPKAVQKFVKEHWTEIVSVKAEGESDSDSDEQPEDGSEEV